MDVDQELLFFSQIDEVTKPWLACLHELWGIWRKSDCVSKMLTDYFDTAPNPYLSTLRLLVNMSDFNRIKNTSSLTFTAAEEFAKWITVRKYMYKDCLVPDLKLGAFRLISRQKNMQFTKSISTTYEFMEHKEVFLDIIENMIRDGKYKEATQYVTMLQLQSFFTDPEILILPLVLQNKLAVAEEFLNNCPNAQKALVTYLDNLISPNGNMHNTLYTYINTNNLTDVKFTMQFRPMTKLLARLVKKYNLPSDMCPNLNQKRNEGALQFLMHKRYVDGSLSKESWREMVREAVGDNSKLQLELTSMLVFMKDPSESLYFAQLYDIPKQKWPRGLVCYEDQINNGASTSREENWDLNDSPSNYHTLSLPKDCIKLVNNVKSFEEFLNKGLNGIHIVGIDSEWKPSFGIKKAELALMQIATETNVYILDVTTIGGVLTELWSKLALTLFENKNILKLGFGISQDIGIIRDSLPALSKVKAHGQGYIDMVNLWRKLIDEHKFVFPYEGDENFRNQSLSKLVELCLGQRLDKSDQFSNWERRPLRESQITYAALDAYCLLEVYNVLLNQCDKMEIPFQEVCAEVQHIPHKSPKKTVKKTLNKPFKNRYEAEKSEAKNHFDIQTNVGRSGQEHRDCSVTHVPTIYRGRLQYLMNLNTATYSKLPSATGIGSRGSIPVHTWRVVCGSMLSDLSNKLRMCGCNCVYVMCGRGGYMSAMHALRENRIHLIRNNDYQKFHQYLPPGHSYKVKSKTSYAQLREVLTNFDVIVKRNDIFSRCQNCNSDEFVSVPKNIMDILASRYAQLTCRQKYNFSSVPSTSASDVSDHCRLPNNEHNLNSAASKEKRNVKRLNRTWRLSSADSLDIRNCLTKYKMHIQIDNVPIKVLKSTELFYVCERCGKVSWDDTDLENFLDFVKDLISD